MYVLVHVHVADDFESLTVLHSTAGGWTMCTSMTTITMALMSISSFNLVGVTTFRFLSIKHPLTFAAKVTHQRAVAAAVTVWVTMFAASCAMFVRVDEPAGNFEQHLMMIGRIICNNAVCCMRKFLY